MTSIFPKEAKIISFINMKGGVGKTTLTKDLGYFLATQRNYKILFIDLDPQSNLTQSFFRKFGYHQENLLDIVDIEAEDDSILEVSSYTSGKKTIGSDISIQKLFKPGVISHLKKDDCLLKLNEYISIIPGTLKAIFSERNSNIENHLFNYINQTKLKEDFDFIFIDCPPTYSNYTISALITSDYFITPSKPDAYSVLGIEMLHEVVKRVKEEHQVYFTNKSLKSLGVIFTELAPYSKGYSDQVHEIKTSSKIQELNIHFFENHFVYNSYIPKRAEYFISDSSSSTKNDLIVLTDEFERRFSEIE
ncbi:AAA family ATPase [Heliorestis acidaminivorans]|uniref:AAA family ATPase n=1 Tax=Heliorestis acidaminivorans TaxID=553427 RepID=A0A6I0EZ74_9FIRM|nr:AAA family ATPase [Heliorestis acidaminivorans]KAB2952162.1 AAA family ATPase [Heliorestis acidaminivorans]